ncbi:MULTISPECIES: hypothetical protein [unclassified Azospirillum]|uniref:hypothetical protein n=1 Tax=unclassified Azospirillum TaxID=2630922 RepID=UPI0011B24425|nr:MULTISPECIES: hypothetical protein [unclassified Azospirillum]
MNENSESVTQTKCRPWMTVPLSNSDEVAIIDVEDYEKLVPLLGSRTWRLNGDGTYTYVRSKLKDRTMVTVARLILGNPWRASVRYLNGNPLDLRKSNLTLSYGGGGVKKTGKGRKRSFV